MQLQGLGAYQHAVDVETPTLILQESRHAQHEKQDMPMLFWNSTCVLKSSKGLTQRAEKGSLRARARETLAQVVIPKALGRGPSDCGQNAIVMHGVTESPCAILDVSGFDSGVGTANDR